MCMFCKNKTRIETNTTHVVNYKNCIIIIIECEQCGEKFYTDEVAGKLERIVDLSKKLMLLSTCL